MQVKLLIFWFCIFLLSLPLHAQELAGVWKGRLQTSASEVPYELVISGDDKKLIGYSLTIFMFNGIENIGVKKIKLKNKKGNISLEDDELIYNNYTTPPKRVKFFGDLFLKSSEKIMVLSGTFHTRSLDMRVTETYDGTVWLQKQKNTDSSKLIAKLDEMHLLQTLSFIAPKKNQEATVVAAEQKNESGDLASRKKEQTTKPVEKKKTTDTIAVATNIKPSITPQKERPPSTTPAEIGKPASAVATRKTEIIQNVFFNSDSLVLSLYDNGEIDGDTVSVVLNNKVVVAKQGLSSNALKTVVHITAVMGDSLQLIMYAENLGRIPPNTGVLILEDGANRHEIRFAGDLQKNSAVILRRKR